MYVLSSKSQKKIEAGSLEEVCIIRHLSNRLTAFRRAQLTQLVLDMHYAYSYTVLGSRRHESTNTRLRFKSPIG